MGFLRTAGEVKDTLAGEVGRLVLKPKLLRSDLDLALDAYERAAYVPGSDPPFAALVAAVTVWLQAVDDHVGDLTPMPIPAEIRATMQQAFLTYCAERRADEDRRKRDATVVVPQGDPQT